CARQVGDDEGAAVSKVAYANDVVARAQCLVKLEGSEAAGGEREGIANGNRSDARARGEGGAGVDDYRPVEDAGARQRSACNSDEIGIHAAVDHEHAVANSGGLARGVGTPEGPGTAVGL